MLLHLPDDLIAECAWFVLLFDVHSAFNFCSASQELQSLVNNVKRWASHFRAEWVQEYANGHLILDRTLVGLQYHSPYNVFAAGNLVPTESVIAWDLYVQLSTYNSGFIDLGVCDQDCKVCRTIFRPSLASYKPHCSQVAWGLNLHTGKLRAGSRINFHDYCTNSTPVQLHRESQETQVIPSYLTKELFRRGSSFTIRIVVDHERGKLCFGTQSQCNTDPNKNIFDYWHGLSFTRNKQFRPHASLFYCTGDLVTISKHFFTK